MDKKITGREFVLFTTVEICQQKGDLKKKYKDKCA
jgi:hypothetical protein